MQNALCQLDIYILLLNLYIYMLHSVQESADTKVFIIFNCRLSSILYRIYFEECVQQLRILVSTPLFQSRSTRLWTTTRNGTNISYKLKSRISITKPETVQIHVVDILPIRAKRFVSSFLMHVAKEYNTISASVFSENY